MNPDQPPAYSEASSNYKPLVNEMHAQEMPQSPYNNQPVQNMYSPPPQHPVYPYGNMPPTPNQFVFATVQQPQPVVQPSTTVNVNTGPVEKRYCCSCCCTCFWIIVIIIIISGIIHGA